MPVLHYITKSPRIILKNRVEIGDQFITEIPDNGKVLYEA
jgi:hypothetical protein